MHKADAGEFREQRQPAPRRVAGTRSKWSTRIPPVPLRPPGASLFFPEKTGPLLPPRARYRPLPPATHLIRILSAGLSWDDSPRYRVWARLSVCKRNVAELLPKPNPLNWPMTNSCRLDELFHKSARDFRRQSLASGEMTVRLGFDRPDPRRCHNAEVPETGAAP